MPAGVREEDDKIVRNVARALATSAFAGAAVLPGYAPWWRKNPSVASTRCAFSWALPYRHGAFGAAYPTVVLGEVPDRPSALRASGRVLKPGGRLLVGEVFPDFHVVPFGAAR